MAFSLSGTHGEFAHNFLEDDLGALSLGLARRLSQPLRCSPARSLAAVGSADGFLEISKSAAGSIRRGELAFKQMVTAAWHGFPQFVSSTTLTIEAILALKPVSSRSELNHDFSFRCRYLRSAS